jgi:PDZ domain-containing protein
MSISIHPAPPDEPVAEERPARRWRRLRWATGIALVLVVAGLIGAATVRVPYYAISPGTAFDVASLVRVSDGNPSFPPDGSVYMTTVSLRHVTAYEAFRGWLDTTVDVVPEDDIRPKSVPADQQEQENLQAMTTSKQQALAVAFEHLGYDTITGTGATIVDVLKRSPVAGDVAIGDTITKVDDTPVELHTDAVQAIRAHEPGDEVRLTVEPKAGGPTREISVALMENPEVPGQALLGVTLRTRDIELTVPYDVAIESADIGGPSAGLAFTLELLDVLTPGELTGGRKVAATGTIELDGSVGLVGGVAQKTVAVRRAGAELFLVPADEVEEARKHAGDDLRVEPVRDLDDALRILAGLGGNGLALGRPGQDGA